MDGNIVGQDPLLAPLANNGGPTQTHGLLSGSPAINASGAGATAADQRGVAAIDIRDIGAFEVIVAVNSLDPDLLFNRLDPLSIREGVEGPILTLDRELAAELGLLDRLNDDGTLRPADAEGRSREPVGTEGGAGDPTGAAGAEADEGGEGLVCPPEDEDADAVNPPRDDEVDCPPLLP